MNNINIDLNLDVIIAEVKSSIAKYKENKTYDRKVYEELLEKYSKLLTIIELLKSEIERLKNKKLPSKNEIESVRAMMNLFGVEKLDSEGIEKFKNISDTFGNKK